MGLWRLMLWLMLWLMMILVVVPGPVWPSFLPILIDIGSFQVIGVVGGGVGVGKVGCRIGFGVNSVYRPIDQNFDHFDENFDHFENFDPNFVHFDGNLYLLMSVFRHYYGGFE